jgi:catechol 2,3-dioxygenase-like lactoylglutathione lyase family enzyme
MILFDPISIPVSNREASRDWYVDILGFRIEFEVPERRTYALVDDADFTIFLQAATGQLGESRPAFTLQVDDVDAKYEELVAKGVPFVSAPAKQYWGYGAELDDPDGYRLMLWDETSMREKG